MQSYSPQLSSNSSTTSGDSSSSRYTAANEDPTDREYVFSRLTSKGYCNLCNIELTSQSHAQSHIQGQKHQKKAEQLERHQKVNKTKYSWHVDPVHIGISIKPAASQLQTVAAAASAYTRHSCAICGMHFNGLIQVQEHIASDKHINKVLMLLERQGGVDPSLTCTACGQTFRGPLDQGWHFESKEHNDQLVLVERRRREWDDKDEGNNQPQITNQTPNAPASFYCEICSISCTSQQNKEDHDKGKKHLRNVENLNIRRIHELHAHQSTESPVNITVECPISNQPANQFSNSSHIREKDWRENVQQNLLEYHTQEKIIVKKEPNFDGFRNEQYASVNTNTDDNRLDNNISLLFKPFAAYSSGQVDDLTEGMQNFGITSENVSRATCMEPSNDFDDREDEVARARYHLEETETLSLGSFASTALSTAKTESDLSSSRSTVAYREVKNNLDYTPPSFPIGRGRGLGVMMFTESLKQKVVNTDVKLEPTYDQSQGFGDDGIGNETIPKEMWNKPVNVDTKPINDSETSASLNLYGALNNSAYSPGNNFTNERSEDLDHYFPSPSNDDVRSESGDSLTGEGIGFDMKAKEPKQYNSGIQQSAEHKIETVQRFQPIGSAAAPEVDDYYFDERLGTGQCLICKVDFTSRKHKDQHVSGKIHRKVKRAQAVIASFESRFGTSDDFLVCKVCSVHFQCLEAKKEHLASPIHKANLEKLQCINTSEFNFCEVCKVPCSSKGNYEQHLLGAQHRKMSGMADEENEALGIDKTLWYPCKVCNCSLNSLEQLRIHENSPAHTAKLEKLQAVGPLGVPCDQTSWFTCNICGCQLNSREQLEIHERSPRHLAKLAKSGITQMPIAVGNSNLTLNNPSVAVRSELPPPATYISARPGFSPSMRQSNMFESPLDRFLSQELFPDEFLPPELSSPSIDGPSSPFELKMTDSPFALPDRYAFTNDSAANLTDDSNVFQSESGSRPRGQMSELAFSTRNKTISSQGKSDRRYSDVQAPTYPFHYENTNTSNANPYAKTHAFYCQTCRAPMNTQESYESHLKGKRHLQKVCTEPAPVREHLTVRTVPYDFRPSTVTQPRNYQLELYRDAIADDSLVFLPTGDYLYS